MDIFQLYKPFRNKVARLSVEEALGVLWAYGQYLQVDDFQFPPEIQVSPAYLQLDVPQKWIAEWTLEILVKEVILNGGVVPTKGRVLRDWSTLGELVNGIKDLENEIYKIFGSPQNVLVELIRIAHRQFVWQGNRPNAASIIRYFKIFNRQKIDEICRKLIGLTVWQTFMCGAACMGHFLTRPALVADFRSEIANLPPELFEKFFAFTTRPIGWLRPVLKLEQEYNANFAYAYSSLRAFPLVRMKYQGGDAIVCPLMTLLYWRFTGGLYYELMAESEFANEFGDGFQTYVGEVIDRVCGEPMQRFGDVEYELGRARKRSVDWIVSDDNAALFLECKAKRLSWGAKVSLTDLAPLEADIDAMASAVVQVYKTLADHLQGAYPHFAPKPNRRIYPAVVTLENWRMFGPVMLDALMDAVTAKILEAGLTTELVAEHPYSIWAVEELERGLQIMRGHGIAEFMRGKLASEEMRQWDWHAYMANVYPNFPSVKSLFDTEYDEMFSSLLDRTPNELEDVQ
jgi:hypothetical protein